MHFLERAYEALLPKVASRISFKDFMRIGALGDITVLEQGSMTGRGARLYNTQVTATAINAGEPVQITLGASFVIPAATNLLAASSPITAATVGVVGIAQTTSTNTATAAGTVDVLPLDPGTTYLINANNSALILTQALYDALVGDRVLIDLTSGSYTMLLTDSALNGCVVQPLDVRRYPGKVAFAFRSAVNYLA